MRRISLLVIALAACGTGDDRADGTRDLCAEGGALNAASGECDVHIETAEQACFRMVDCGAMPLHQADPYRFDWDNCVDEIQSAADVQQRLMLACVASATCDQLKLNDNGRRACFAYGDN